MTQRDPDPASLPEAIPVLAYERQTDDGAMDWVVRFVGAWVICSGAASASPQVVEMWRSGLLAIVDVHYWQQLCLPALLLCNLALIGFSIAITRRYRFGFRGGLAMVGLGLMPELVSALSAPGARVALFGMLYTVLPAAASFAVLLSVLRRADAKGILRPFRANRLNPLQDSDSIGFLISRIGWLYLAWGGRLLVHLAILPLYISAGTMDPKQIWSWQMGLSIALFLAVGTCGLLLHQRKVWALGLLASLLLIHVTIQFVIQWSYAPARANLTPWLLYVYLSSVLETGTSVFMLCLLARKAARTPIPSH